MNYESLFADSLKLYQQLVDILAESKDETGFSLISQPEIATRIGRSQTWVASAIKRLNTEDICIELVSNGKYKLNYENLLLSGVFSKILVLIRDTQLEPSIFSEKDSVIAEKYGISVKTVQMYKSYLRTGWKVSTKD